MPVRTTLRLMSVLAFVLAALVAAPNPSEAKVVTEVVELPVKVLDAKAQPVEKKIKVTIVRDDARAKSAFLILNHGRGKNKEINGGVSARPFLGNARYFVLEGLCGLHAAAHRLWRHGWPRYRVLGHLLGQDVSAGL